MNPSRAAIYAAVESLRGLDGSPSMFQRLAEGYAQRMFPWRFGRLVPGGMNPEGIAVRGWPDAYAMRPDGKIDAMEATLAKDWRRHLDRDLEHVRKAGPGKIGGFLLVAWEPVPDREEEDAWRRRFAELGVPFDEVNLVFSRELVRDLCHARFAPLWADPLSLPTTCHPFARIREVEGLYGKEGTEEVFAPSLSEYEAGVIHRPALLTEVEERLQGHHWAWVRGRGATGKTVLGTLIALDREATGLPAYYLDLADMAEPESHANAGLFEAVTSRADDGVLFLIDNIHLDPQLTSALYRHWREVRQGSDWLMLSRIRELGPDPRGRAEPLDALRPEALELENAAADLLGVYRRLVRRQSSSAEDPPPEILNHWQGFFAADLIAFSAAIVGRLVSVAHGDWRLTGADARAYVRREYLAGSAEERQAILQLAAMTSLELTTPEIAFEISVLDRNLQKGVVLSSQYRNDRKRHFRLVHPGLGELILAVKGDTASRMRPLIQLASGSAHLAVLIARRLEGQGRRQDAAAILEILASRPQKLARFLTNNGRSLMGSPGRIRLLTRLGVRSPAEVDAILAREHDRLVAAALRTPLGHLASSMDYLRVFLPSSHAWIVRALAAEENQKELLKITLRTSLQDLTQFLTYACVHLPGVHEALSQIFVSEQYKKALLATALRSDLGTLKSFLMHASAHLPGVHEALAQAFVSEQYGKELVATALRGHLRALALFLRYVRVHLPEVHAALSQALVSEQCKKELVATALRGHLGAVTSFLRYTHKDLPSVYHAMVRTLSAKESQEPLRDAILRTEPEYLVSLLKFSQKLIPSLHQTVVATMVAEQKELLVRLTHRTPLDHLASFLDYLRKSVPQLYGAVSQALTSEESTKRLLAAAFQTQSNNLIPFLVYVRAQMPSVHDALVEALLSESGRREMVKQGMLETVLRTSLANVTPFLRYMREHVPAIHDALVEAMLSENGRQEMIRAILESDIDQTVAFLAHARDFVPGLVGHLLDGICADDWRGARSSRCALPNEATAFVSLSRALGSVARYDLLAVTAEWILETLDLSESSESFHLHHLSSLLFHGRTCDRVVVTTFVERALSKPWLKQRYQSVYAGSVARSLCSIWQYHPQVIGLLHHPELLHRLRRELFMLHRFSGEELVGSLRFLGVADLLGVPTPKLNNRWPREDTLLTAASEASCVPDEIVGITVVLSQLWLGLRTMMRLRGEPICVPAVKGQHLLDMWHAAEAETERMQTFNDWMIAWLERCAEAGWRLLPDETRFEDFAKRRGTCSGRTT